MKLEDFNFTLSSFTPLNSKHNQHIRNQTLGTIQDLNLAWLGKLALWPMINITREWGFSAVKTLLRVSAAVIAVTVHLIFCLSVPIHLSIGSNSITYGSISLWDWFSCEEGMVLVHYMFWKGELPVCLGYVIFDGFYEFICKGVTKTSFSPCVC